MNTKCFASPCIYGMNIIECPLCTGGSTAQWLSTTVPSNGNRMEANVCNLKMSSLHIRTKKKEAGEMVAVIDSRSKDVCVYV